MLALMLACEWAEQLGDAGREEIGGHFGHMLAQLDGPASIKAALRERWASV